MLATVLASGCGREQVGRASYQGAQFRRSHPVSDPKAVFATVASAGDDMEAFFNSLPISTDSLHAPEEWDREEIWRVGVRGDSSEALAFLSLRYEPPDIGPMLAQGLVLNGDTVKEVRNRRANGRIGVATCQAGKPVVMYGLDAQKWVSPYTFVFFRHHEFAHHLLNHVTCAGSPRVVYPLESQHEFDADCKARTLLMAFPDGGRVVDRAAERLYSLGMPRSGHHPSTRARAEYLDHRCS